MEFLLLKFAVFFPFPDIKLKYNTFWELSLEFSGVLFLMNPFPLQRRQGKPKLKVSFQNTADSVHIKFSQKFKGSKAIQNHPDKQGIKKLICR